MITETLLNSLKSLFSSLGAKTSDNNYAVGLFDKTNGEPKGMMGMSDLASVLGVTPGRMISYGVWISNVDADQLNWGLIYCGDGATHVPASYMMILTMGDTSDRCQIGFSQTTKLWYRRYGSGEWSTF